MFCTFCGKSYEEHQNFCTNCGRSVPASRSESEQPPAPPAQFAGTISDAAGPVSGAIGERAGPEATNTSFQSGYTRDLTGLSGWLIVVGIELFATLYFRAHGVVKGVRAYTSSSMHVLTDPGSQFHVLGFVALLRLEITGHAVFFIADACLIYLFFTRRRAFPGYFIFYFWAFLVFAILDVSLVQIGMVTATSQRFQQLMAQNILHEGFRVLGTAVAAILWTLYMLKSRRVKQTFLT